MKKRLAAFILAAITVICCAFTSHATDADTYEQGIECEYFWFDNVIVITYDESYTAIGNTVTATLQCIDWDEKELTVDVSGDGIVQKIYEYEGKRYPQAFIAIPADKNVTAIRIDEGAFSDSNGNYSKEVNYTICETTHHGTITLFCKGLEATGADERLEIVEDSSVELSCELSSIYSDVWKDDIAYSITSETETVELDDNTGLLTEKGEYTASVSINNILTSQKEISVSSKSKAYFTSLGKSFGNMILSPITFLYGLFYAIFVPGPGTLIGTLGLLGSLASIPLFFTNLFAGPSTEVLTF